MRYQSNSQVMVSGIHLDRVSPASRDESVHLHHVINVRVPGGHDPQPIIEQVRSRAGGTRDLAPSHRVSAHQPPRISALSQGFGDYRSFHGCDVSEGRQGKTTGGIRQRARRVPGWACDHHDVWSI
jgi:hypothetical protein